MLRTETVIKKITSPGKNYVTTVSYSIQHFTIMLKSTSFNVVFIWLCRACVILWYFMFKAIQDFMIFYVQGNTLAMTAWVWGFVLKFVFNPLHYTINE